MPLVLASCGDKVLVSTYAEVCVGREVLELLRKLCDVRLVELPTECVLSGIKVPGGTPYKAAEGCAYMEFSQGLYVGFLPGFVDAQCVYCGSDLRCRYSLQKRACRARGLDDRVEHLDLRSIAVLAEKLITLPGSFFWCVDERGELYTHGFGFTLQTRGSS